MKRTIIITVIALICLVMASELEATVRRTPFYDSGYAGNVEVNAGGVLGGRLFTSITTVHGCSFSNGLFAGIGAGVDITPENAMTTYAIPFFLDVRYSFLEGHVSPFVDMRFGGYYSVWENVGLHASPSAGVDIGRWSIFLRYAYMTAEDRMYDSDKSAYFNLTSNRHALTLGVDIWF